jgi:hypothetical protein
VSPGFARLRKGRGGKAIAGYGRIWGQAEDPEEVEREEKEREKKEKEARFKEVMTREPPPMHPGPSSGGLSTAMPSTPMLSMGPMAMSQANKKRKRTVSMALATNHASSECIWRSTIPSNIALSHSSVSTALKGTLYRLFLLWSRVCKPSIDKRSVYTRI